VAGTDETSKLLGPFLESYYHTYYPALRDFLRLGMMVSCSHEPDDLIQGFVADRILAKSIIKTACRDRGKLSVRSYILACLANYVRDNMKSKARREWSALECISDETVDCLSSESDLAPGGLEDNPIYSETPSPNRGLGSTPRNCCLFVCKERYTRSLVLINTHVCVNRMTRI
jgi:hypothetical protein